MKKYDDFQEFLVKRFLLILAYVVTSEYLIRVLLDGLMMPVIQLWFFEDLQLHESLSIVEILTFVGLLLIELLLGAVQAVLPRAAQGSLQTALHSVEGFVEQVIPEIAGTHSVNTLSGWKAFLLFLMIFVAVVLIAVPFVGAAIWFSKIVHDEVKRRDETKEELYQEYERNKNLLLSDIAHDLRTPITTIAGYAKALNDGMVTDEEKRAEYLEAIENKSVRMSELITLLFDYVKLGSEGFQLSLEQVDLSELMRENAALLYSDVEEKGMEFVIDIPEEPCKVLADPLQISRVVTNIITNAIRHNESGTTITIELHEESDEIEVIISDNGVTIAEEIAEHIFDPFAVGDKSRRTKGGSGLGLSIAKRIVDMHGWKLALYQNRRGYKKAFIINIKKA